MLFEALEKVCVNMESFENLNLSALWMILKGSALGFRGRDLSLAVGAPELCGILTIVDNC